MVARQAASCRAKQQHWPDRIHRGMTILTSVMEAPMDFILDLSKPKYCKDAVDCEEWITRQAPLDLSIKHPCGFEGVHSEEHTASLCSENNVSYHQQGITHDDVETWRNHENEAMSEGKRLPHWLIAPRARPAKRKWHSNEMQVRLENNLSPPVCDRFPVKTDMTTGESLERGQWLSWQSGLNAKRVTYKTISHQHRGFKGQMKPQIDRRHPTLEERLNCNDSCTDSSQKTWTYPASSPGLTDQDLSQVFGSTYMSTVSQLEMAEREERCCSADRCTHGSPDRQEHNHTGQSDHWNTTEENDLYLSDTSHLSGAMVTSSGFAFLSPSQNELDPQRRSTIRFDNDSFPERAKKIKSSHQGRYSLPTNKRISSSPNRLTAEHRPHWMTPTVQDNPKHFSLAQANSCMVKHSAPANGTLPRRNSKLTFGGKVNTSISRPATSGTWAEGGRNLANNVTINSLGFCGGSVTIGENVAFENSDIDIKPITDFINAGTLD